MRTPLSPEQTRALQVLDPASPPDPARALRRPAQDLLSRLMSISEDPYVAATRTSVRQPIRRIVLVGAVAALTCAAAVILPIVTAPTPAAASWKAVPHALAPDVAAARGEDCLRRYDELPVAHRQGARPIIVEQRGAYTFTLITSPAGLEATCLIRDNGGKAEPSGGGSIWMEPRIQLAPDGLLTEGMHVGSDDDMSTRNVVGRLGADVIGVIVHTAQQGDVTATVADGAFAAWWPGAPLVGADPVGAEPSFTLTLKDGTTRDFDISEVDVTR